MPGVTAGGTTAPRGGSRTDRAGAPDMCSEPSQPMFRPDGADLFVCRELTARSFSQRIVYVRFFLWREHVRCLDNARRGRLKDLFHGSLPASAVDCTRKIISRLPTPRSRRQRQQARVEDVRSRFPRHRKRQRCRIDAGRNCQHPGSTAKAIADVDRADRRATGGWLPR